MNFFYDINDFFPELLLENLQENISNLQNAITNKFVCNIDYRGERTGIVLDGMRVIEPYTIGTDSKGNTLLRAWLIKGISRTGRINPRLVPGWRLFRVDRIRTIIITPQKFTVPRKGYNAQDKMMDEVNFFAQF